MNVPPGAPAPVPGGAPKSDAAAPSAPQPPQAPPAARSPTAAPGQATPAIGRGAAPVAAEAKPDAAPRPRRCLIVDDSRVVRKVSRRIVESLGYQVTEAENGEEALNRCKADMPDLILMDWDMPVMTGIEFVSKMRALKGPHRPKAVFCTSKNDTMDIHKGIAAGADEYVVKPFDEETLKAKLERIGAI